MKFFLALLITVSIYVAQSSVLFAYQIPNFTSCINPKGEIKASYNSGTHGIVGSTNAYTGQDTVYSVLGNALTQCFCASDGKGIQTNWWKISELTEVEINSLKSQGWNYVPNGALWGLEETAYLAFNSEYVCKKSQGFTPTTDIPGPGGFGGFQGGGVAGISAGMGQVLGLASTGNSKFLLSVLLVSGISLSVGLFLKKRIKNISK